MFDLCEPMEQEQQLCLILQCCYIAFSKINSVIIDDGAGQDTAPRHNFARHFAACRSISPQYYIIFNVTDIMFDNLNTNNFA